MRLGSKGKQTVAASLAAIRAEAAWRCVSVLAPDLKGEAKLDMARRILSVADGVNRSEPTPQTREITPAQVEGIVWANMQCINPYCSMLLFSKQIADELNQFFAPEE